MTPKAYKTLFVGTLVQESFLSIGGREDADSMVDSPFCTDGKHRPTLRGTGLAGALIATLRRLKGDIPIPVSISGSDHGQQPSLWRFFNSHPTNEYRTAYRQHVAINPRTGAADNAMLFNVEALPPGTHWTFLLEVDNSQDLNASNLAREALAHWAAGRCLLGRDVARGLGWMRLDNLREYQLTTKNLVDWPCSLEANNYVCYIQQKFGEGEQVKPAGQALPGWIEITGFLVAGERADGYGIDSLSIGGHASEEIAAQYDERFLTPDALPLEQAKQLFYPDFAIATFIHYEKLLPYVPGSALRGPLRHALTRLLRAKGGNPGLADMLFGTQQRSAKLLIRDALPPLDKEIFDKDIRFAWLQHHAEDEFTGGPYSSAKFDRMAVMQSCFSWKMVLELEDKGQELKDALRDLFALMKQGQIGIGGGQWRGHGWLRWEIDDENVL